MAQTAGRISYRSFLMSLDAIDGVLGNLPEHANEGAYVSPFFILMFMTDQWHARCCVVFESAEGGRRVRVILN